jgi:heme/copper-type cytochrome/quinol oxidase subunit 2
LKSKIKGLLKKAKNKATQLTIMISVFLMNSGTVFAADPIQSSTIYTGTKKLINDATTAAMIISPILTILLVIYFLIRKSAADEMDQKKWHNRIMIAVVCGIGVVVAAATINMLNGYYQ